MNPDSSTNSWDNKWNQSSDQTIPTDGNNCYTVADGTWDAGGGSWSFVSKDYYLFGFINGANYGCEEDASNIGSYKFENGKLIAFFVCIINIFQNRNKASWSDGIKQFEHMEFFFFIP